MSSSDAANAFFDAQRARIMGTDTAGQTLGAAIRAMNQWGFGKKWAMKPPAKAKAKGHLQFVLDDGLQKATVQMLSTAAPAVLDAFKRHFVPMAEAAINRWPVRSGFSKRFLSVAIEPANQGQAVRMRFSSSAPYTYQIKWGKNGDTRGSSAIGAPVWKELLADQLLPVSTAMVDEIKANL